jgi:hypothetical protein
MSLKHSISIKEAAFHLNLSQRSLNVLFDIYPQLNDHWYYDLSHRTIRVCDIKGLDKKIRELNAKS